MQLRRHASSTVAVAVFAWIEPQNPWKNVTGGASGQEKCPEIPNHPSNVNLDQNIRTANQQFLNATRAYIHPALAALAVGNWFYNLTKTGGDWDIKTKYNNLAYDDFGNFHFGATGLATGVFTEGQLLREAGRASIKDGNKPPPGEDWGYPPSTKLSPVGGKAPFGDDPHAQEMIKRGFEYLMALKRGCVH